VLRWMAANCAKSEDPAGNIKPDKAKSKEKIDGIVATVMALSLWMEFGKDLGSYYDKNALEIG
jgi:phage terminase large subunit-like protein